eukprot:gnl/TRDRNA2_/TRDRNA2_195675_c0_seq1.p1 gnl/TRDRNA2_/TRDRNA2_195675_c0~~gnl/TRDRNA2_/TRDRNA2_195675_c0_seq1.p1  ORF type:complete len:109 (-),score=17.53 gnl/TRDRNA2_/TRDRNA2_195675_c0_seq1:127-453(-)
MANFVENQSKPFAVGTDCDRSPMSWDDKMAKVRKANDKGRNGLAEAQALGMLVEYKCTEPRALSPLKRRREEPTELVAVQKQHHQHPMQTSAWEREGSGGPGGLANST